ncbi:MAG TPA: AraC family transcriptional regulator [Candidatus Saccharimonadia bacterium]|nr:AraC family transcriptional regulator [Candidatus Saccharimonadia bacterium]
MNKISSTILSPPLELRPYINCFRVNQYPGKNEVSVLVCPNGLPGMLLQTHPNNAQVNRIATDGDTLEDVPTLFVYGQITKPNTMHFGEGPFANVQVLFEPSALRSLFGIDATTITDGYLTPDRFGAQTLVAELSHIRSTDEYVRIISDFFRCKLQEDIKKDSAIEEALTFIREHIDDVSVSDVLSHVHVSERQFEKRFLLWVGINPRLYIRIVRFNKAMELINAGTYERLSDVAAALNFHDQSHFIRDMKIFSKITPKSISMKAIDFYHDQVGSSYTSK